MPRLKLIQNLLITTALLGAPMLVSSCQKSSSLTVEQRELVQSESQRLAKWFEERYNDEIDRSPMTATYLGMDQDQDRLDDTSKLADDETAALTEAWLTEMRKSFDPDRLDDTSKLSYRLYEFAAEDALASHERSGSDYIFQHMSGPNSSLPSFMINFHGVSSAKDAENYISRLGQFETYLGHLADRAETQAQNGILLPKFAYAKLRDASENIIKGEPFDGDGSSPLWDDISGKIEALENVDTDAKTRLKDAAKNALLTSVRPAYDNLIEQFSRHERMATDDDGIWRLPGGETYYQTRLNHYTTAQITPDEIHDIGVKDVARIQAEMREIMQQIGFEGSLQEFFTHLRTDPKFKFENNDEGREAYMAQASEVIAVMKAKLDDLFITKPKADLIVKRVEPFREATAFGAFYNRPAPDGSRPGTYYINLKDMAELPIYQLQALAYHEGIPGHHMQIAIGMELEDLPKFRTMGGHTAYIEGWALYSESLPKELGLYTDPYQDFGRLSMEIFRSARLVLDTGIHAKKWTREQAVDYMMKNTANSEGDIRAEIDRYIVWPGQATAYKVGMIKIEALRAKAETALGDKFDIREFHDVILANGSVPLTILEELVDSWIAAQQ